ncbi:MAG: DUF4347 domain-containing protein, partial [Pseudomonadales bacterium]|nr:DUF4347 domain-containing protein [Pseudomonadales bacterium]
MSKKNTLYQRPVIEILESRILYSATVDIVLVDDALADQALLEEAAQNVDRYIVFNSETDSAAQIIAEVTQWAADHDQQIDSLSIFSHGDDGQFQLGNESIDTQSVLEHADLWSQLGEALDDEANIYLLGCEVGLGEKGQLLLDTLAEAAHADVFASDDLTGKGGDWLLEVADSQSQDELVDGLITAPVNTTLLQDYSSTLATYSTSAMPSTNNGGWDDAANAYSDDGSRTDGNEGAHVIYSGFNHDFSAASEALISGIQITMQTELSNENLDVNIRISFDGTNWSNWKNMDFGYKVGTGEITKTVGSNTDFWGLDLSGLDANALTSTDFQVEIEHNYSSQINDPADIQVDYVQATVHYNQDTAPTATPGSASGLEGGSTVITLA